jgi:hypothetical protein
MLLFRRRRSSTAKLEADLPSATLERGEEARHAISWTEGSHMQGTAHPEDCRRTDRWSLYLADLGIFFSGFAVLVPGDVRDHIIDLLSRML